MLSEEGRLAPQHVPQMLHFDPTLPGIAMAFIGPPAVMLRLGLNQGNVCPFLIHSSRPFPPVHGECDKEYPPAASHEPTMPPKCVYVMM